ncbi:DUF4232 domain-containing protein [Kitasatospora brasiliensis]|uniref:DUF4232 domain-containing protein n=1 Tax=Kitasatospora brasiliensis TaxID=3058040 RepID=UPI00293006EC|nr:DUF4232 domain-containing protein [Kitasatospora sp. K002]
MTVRRPARLVAVGVAALAATVLLTACDDVKYTDDKPGDPKASAAGATVPNDPMAEQAAGSRCKSDEISATVQLKGAGSALLTIKNKSNHNCTLYGYAGFGGLRADNSADALTANRDAHPGPATLVTLKPDKAGYAGLKWSACDKSDASCHVLTGLQVTAPDETTPVTAEVLGTDGKPVSQLLVSAAGLTTGTLQKSNDKVLFN